MEQLYLLEVYIESIELNRETLENIETTENPHVILNVHLNGLGLSLEIDQDEFEEDLRSPQATIGKEHNINEKSESIIVETMASAESLESYDRFNKIMKFPIRAGKSCLFGGYNDSIVEIMERNSLEFSLRLKSSDCKHSCVGAARALWDAKVLQAVADRAGTGDRSVTQLEELIFRNEETTKTVGKLYIFIRFSVLGSNVRTRFHDIVADDSTFIFRSAGEYELLKCRQFGVKSVKTQDSRLVDAATKKTFIKETHEIAKETTQMDKIKGPVPDMISFKQIVGPCGKAVCPLAKKLKEYLKREILHKAELESRRERGEVIKMPEDPKCSKKTRIDDGTDTDSPLEDDLICSHCGGKSLTGKTCDDDTSKDHSTILKCCPCLSSGSSGPLGRDQNCYYNPYRLNGTPVRKPDRNIRAKDISVGPEYMRLRNFLQDYVEENNIAVELEHDDYSIVPIYVCGTKCAAAEDCNKKKCVRA